MRSAANDLPLVRDAHVTGLDRFHQGFIAVFQYLAVAISQDNPDVRPIGGQIVVGQLTTRPLNSAMPRSMSTVRASW